MKNLAWTALAILSLLVVGCGGPGSTTRPASTPSPNPAPQPQAPAYWPTMGWQASTPEEQGMDSELLARGLEFLQGTKADSRIHSVLIVRHGYIVTEAYFHPFTPDSGHDVASVTKSVMATLVGIAIDEGHIADIRQPVIGFFPDRAVAHVDANKQAMTLEDLLTMRSGLDCAGGPQDILEMCKSPDWIQFALDRPMSEEPGTRSAYCNLNPHLLSAIVQQTTGASALTFAQEHLFEPLGIADVSWPADPQGNHYGWGSIRMAPRDMAKLGYLYLHAGRWDDQQIVSPSWVRAATSVQTRIHDNGYGYLWWIRSSSDYYEAVGRGGQSIAVLPDDDLVVVLTGGGGRVLSELLRSYVTPAVRSTTQLPANPTGVALLETRIRQAAEPAGAGPQPVPPLPAMAAHVSGQTYELDDNFFGVLDFSLAFEEPDVARFRWALSFDVEEGQEVEYHVGLDGVARVAPGRLGIPAAAKGAWESEKVFVIHLDEIGNIYAWHIRLAFDEDRVTVQMQELGTELGSSTFDGRIRR